MFEGGTVSTLRGLAATALLGCAAGAIAQDGALPVESIDLYGSAMLATPEIVAEVTPDVLRYAELGRAAAAPNADLADLERSAHAIEDKLRAALNARVPLAHFGISAVTNFDPQPAHMNITIDVVELADAARRMPFHAAPTRELTDPDGVLAVWSEYLQKVFELAFAGRPLRVGPAECPALHCVAPFDWPELAPYLPRFEAAAREHEDELYAIAAESRTTMYRANALFVLAHTNDAARLSPLLGRSMFDPDEGVRNNALRTLMFMAQGNAERDYPLDALLEAFDFPATSDRNKAGWTLVALAASPRYRDKIRAEAVPVALKLLRLDQPINHGPAYALLTTLSGESYGERDYVAWEAWAARR